MPAAAGAVPHTVVEPGLGTLEVFALGTSEAALLALLTDIFENHWQSIQFGPLIEGAAWEIVAPNAPRKIAMLDGYLTVDFGAWHFHLCIGPHRGSAAAPVSPALAAHRRTARAELYRQLNDDGAPNSWGLRLLNGHDEQQLTVFLPNPFLTDDLRPSPRPDWSRLALCDHLRHTTLGLPPRPQRPHRHRFRAHMSRKKETAPVYSFLPQGRLRRYSNHRGLGAAPPGKTGAAARA